MHVLGYFLPPDSPPLEDFLEGAGGPRPARPEMVDRLRALGREPSTSMTSWPVPRWRRGAAARGAGAARAGRVAGTSARRSTAISAGAGRPSSRRRSRRSPRWRSSSMRCGGIVSVAHLKDRGTRAFLERLKGQRPRRGRDPSSRATTLTPAPDLPTSRSRWGCSAPAAATGTAILRRGEPRHDRFPGGAPRVARPARPALRPLRGSMSSPRLDRFSGKVALVTGVGRAGQIGNAVALAFGQAGRQDRGLRPERGRRGRAGRASSRRSGVDARPCAGDLTQPDIAALAVEIALRHFGRLDVVVNVAGGLTTYGPLGEAHRGGLRPRDRHQPQDHGAGVPGRDRGAESTPAAASSTSPRSPTSSRRSRWPCTAPPRRRGGIHPEPRARARRPAHPGERRGAGGMVRTSDNVAAMGDDAAYVELQDITDGVLQLAAPDRPPSPATSCRSRRPRPARPDGAARPRRAGHRCRPPAGAGAGPGARGPGHDTRHPPPCVQRRAPSPSATRSPWRGGRAACFPADLSDAQAARALPQRVVEEFGRLDVLVNSAAVMHRLDLEDTTPEQYDAILDLNLRSVFFCTQGAAAALRAARGKVVNLADLAGPRTLAGLRGPLGEQGRGGHADQGAGAARWPPRSR